MTAETLQIGDLVAPSSAFGHSLRVRIVTDISTSKEYIRLQDLDDYLDAQKPPDNRQVLPMQSPFHTDDNWYLAGTYTKADTETMITWRNAMQERIKSIEAEYNFLIERIH